MRTILGSSNYKVTKSGKVYSVKRKKYLSPGRDNAGYLQVNLTFDNGKKRKSLRIHRLVATAYIQNPNNYPEVNHIDFNKQNNNVNNLEWCTRIHNYNHHRKSIGLQDTDGDFISKKEKYKSALKSGVSIDFAKYAYGIKD